MKTVNQIDLHHATTILKLTDRVVGIVTRADITRAAEKFGGEKEAAELMVQLGFPKEAVSTKLVAIVDNYIIYNTEARESTIQIATDLCRLATDQSYVPSMPHPIVPFLHNSEGLLERLQDLANKGTDSTTNDKVQSTGKDISQGTKSSSGSDGNSKHRF